MLVCDFVDSVKTEGSKWAMSVTPFRLTKIKAFEYLQQDVLDYTNQYRFVSFVVAVLLAMQKTSISCTLARLQKAFVSGPRSDIFGLV